jgi:hypothetical protein
MYRNSEILQKLPEDTLVCLLTEIPQLFSQSGENTHKDAVSTFLGIIQLKTLSLSTQRERFFVSVLL